MPDQSVAVPRLLLFEYSELNPAYRADPHALLDPQRAGRPAEHDGMMPIVLVSVYDAGRDVLLDKTLTRDFADAAKDNPVIASVFKIGDQVEAEFGPHVSMLILEDPRPRPGPRRHRPRVVEARRRSAGPDPEDRR